MEKSLVFGESICKMDETESESSESENEENQRQLSAAIPVPLPFNTSQCAYRYPNGTQCGVPLSLRMKQLFGSYCMAHYILQYDYNKVTTVTWKNKNILERQQHDVDSSPKRSESSIHQRHNLVKSILKELQDNHDKLTSIIQNHLPIISSRSRLGKYMIQF